MTTDWGREILRSPKYSEELERLGYTIPKEYQTVRGGLMIDRNEMRIRLYDTVSDGWDDPQDVSLDSLSDLIGDRRPRSDQIEISKEILRSIAWNQDPDTFEPEKKGKIVEMPTGAGEDGHRDDYDPMVDPISTEIEDRVHGSPAGTLRSDFSRVQRSLRVGDDQYHRGFEKYE